jgi:hypothetical protein
LSVQKHSATSADALYSSLFPSTVHMFFLQPK